MANPAPTINQINAFNATQGTTIDFNIIGGTELVRSNRIYIYDLSDNSLICTHLYVSTESIHELPPNTDSSIVYESGKSSADFVNGAQYYAQIQTFTDIGGTEGGSGLSVAKMFWCLVDPSLTISTIPSSISTTSYNVSATYDANTSVVSNIIQQYQFSLYSATGSLSQSSGVVVGNGEQQGTSTAYDISYNFTGLSVGSSYYVVVDITTTQGMSVSVQSNTFTVSIDTPTLGEATVVNNACDGYISVTSNLSSEYGGSGSGDIVSFETDSENVFTKLQVDLEPVQDLHGYDKPWVGGAGENKLNMVDVLPNGSYNGDVFTCTSVSNPTVALFDNPQTVTFSYESGTYTGTRARLEFLNGSTVIGTKGLDSASQTSQTFQDVTAIRFNYGTGGTLTLTKPQLELGSTATSWTPYSNICPIYGHDSVGANVSGVNVFDENVEEGDLSSQTGQPISASTYVRSADYFPIKGGTTYYLKTGASTYKAWVYFYDSEYNFVQYTGAKANTTITTNSDVAFCKICARKAEYDNNVSLNYPSTDIDYHAYNGTTYPISWQTEAGTVYGGMLDLVSGQLTVTHKLTTITTFDGDFGQRTNGYCVYKSLGDKRDSTDSICNMFERSTLGVDNMPLGTYQGASGAYTTWSFIIPSTITSLAEANTWLSNLSEPLVLTETLATPLTYQLTPQQIQTLVGQNNVWSEQGNVELSYHIPITNLLVKRQDVDDVSGDWLTLYSQPVSQASDMDFTFIDFLNQYGKTYKYALVPLLTQTQSGVEVEVEGGYTVSDEVQSIFDGVFISDSTGSQKCKANVGYGNVNMNQSVGSITPIGSQYPIIVTNSNNRYHNGSISGMIVPDDYYYNGNLSRIDMVNKRNELEQFLTNKRAKIIKDWNSNIWLVMIMDNIDCSFDNNYGMGIVTFNANWLEVGDPTNQEDLQATGLVDVGGV